ncbi:hypothetical protein EST38_g6805 [Candolleomyces aberdarensis]|uniref:Peptidase C14 caspase domain-containing protein n=1 Tax=Candolleomyces aberdarensis TaxID=2316362 RepID=A0A4Q2DIP3_9AGAR|nr:hypothetical protein EST38_g6805 [Candolleomyces aberdarensis]
MPRDYDEEENEYPEEEQEEQPEEETEEAPEEEQEERDGEGEEEGESWSYSTCSGNKKAVFIGINYANSSAPLNGCHNDVDNLHTFVTENWGYSDAEIKILLDNDEDEETQPTGENIRAALIWLVEGASQNDALFLHYSGHGGNQEDTDGDEHDGTDETICPIDYEENGQIVDDELHEILVKPLPRGCRLTVIFDCCHSGSGLDLPYTYGTDGLVKVSSSLGHSKEAIEAAMQAHSEGNDDALALAARHLSLAATGQADAAHELTKATKTSPADVIFLSGCKDIQTSADATIGGEATGALSHALVKTLTENSEQSYTDLLNNIRQILEGEYSQIPQLSSSHPMDTSLTFII